MKTIKLSELPSQIDCLEIVSCEGSIYLANIIWLGEKYRLRQSDAGAYQRRNIKAVVQDLDHVKINSCHMIHNSAYDEFIGQPGRHGSNQLLVPYQYGSFEG